MDIKAYLKEKKLAVDSALKKYFDSLEEYPSKLKESMWYSVKAGGKRLRPTLALSAAEACSGDASKAMPVALAMEMIHTFSLIHDDLPSMDDDDLRRGMPTNHKVFGDAMAILAGDALLSEAMSCLVRGDYQNQIEIIRDIADATGARGMTQGQAMDLQAEGRNITADELEMVHRFKTGVLIRVSLTSGAKAVGAKESELIAITRYGEKIGLAFQIADDILDIEGSTEEIGKPSGSDIENNKSTYPSLLGLERSRKMASGLIGEALDSLVIFSGSADPLREIAKYVISRKN